MDSFTYSIKAIDNGFILATEWEFNNEKGWKDYETKETFFKDWGSLLAYLARTPPKSTK